MDATILQKAPMPKKWFDLDFYTFKVNGIPYAYTNVSQAQRCVFFFICKKNNPLMLALVDLWNTYWLKFDYIIDYFCLDYMWNLCYLHLPEVKHQLDAVPVQDKDVLIWIFSGSKMLSLPCTEDSYREIMQEIQYPLLKMSAKGLINVPKQLPTGELTLKGCILKYDI